jgi:hypothetical protein
MPGGVGGPRRILGVGFWAQQEYFGVYSVTDTSNLVVRGPFKGLPEQPPPANAFQSWTYSYNLNLIGQDRFPTGEQFWERPQLPIPPPALTWTAAGTGPPMMAGATMGVTLRPPLKGLPEQPPQLLQQWTLRNFNVLQPVTLIIRQTDWPVPFAPQQPAQTWTWQYNPNLIGKDAMLAGEQSYALAPSQVVPDQIQLRAWAWSYNLSLIGKDRMLVGDQITELVPSQKPPEQVQLHSWTFSYNLNLIGKDAMLIGEQITDLPPRDPRDVRTWAWSYNLNLIGQDRMLAGEQIWERPTLPVPPALTWISTPALIAKPFLQTDWPNPIPPYRVDQTWSWSYNLNLIGQDKMLTGEQITDLPPRDFARILQTWIQQTNLALLVTPPVLNVTISKYFDRPQLPIPPALSWEWSYNKNLIGQDQLPFRQQDWPNPIPPALVKDWIQQTNLALLTQPPALLPYKRSHYELPIAGPQQGALSWTWQYNLNLIGQDAMIRSARITDLPPPDFARVLQTWIQQTNLALLTAPIGLPFLSRNQDWPPPRGAEPDWRRSWEWSYNKNLIGQDAMIKSAQVYDLAPIYQPYINQLRTWAWQYNLNLIGQDERLTGAQIYDLPPALTPTAQRAADLATWIDRVKWWLFIPFRQTDWPNPTQPFRDPTLTSWAANYNVNLIGQDRMAFRQQDWPNPIAPDPYASLRAWTLPLNIGLTLPPLVPPLALSNKDWPVPMGPIQPNRGFTVPFNPNLPPTPPVVTPSVLNKPMLAGPGYLNVIPGEKPS